MIKQPSNVNKKTCMLNLNNLCVAVHKINFIIIGYNPQKMKKDSYMPDVPCCSMY